MDVQIKSVMEIQSYSLIGHFILDFIFNTWDSGGAWLYLTYISTSTISLYTHLQMPNLKPTSAPDLT